MRWSLVRPVCKFYNLFKTQAFVRCFGKHVLHIPMYDSSIWLAAYKKVQEKLCCIQCRIEQQQAPSEDSHSYDLFQAPLQHVFKLISRVYQHGAFVQKKRSMCSSRCYETWILPWGISNLRSKDDTHGSWGCISVQKEDATMYSKALRWLESWARRWSTMESVSRRGTRNETQL